MKATLKTYCDRDAEPLAIAFAAQAAAPLCRTYGQVLTIPVYDEHPKFLTQVLPPQLENCLVILVFNAPAEAEFAAAQTRTEAGLRALSNQPDALTLVPWKPGVDLLVVDCCSLGRRLPYKQGVGLARKLAGDLAIAARLHGYIASPWIHCTDADVHLPDDYFESIQVISPTGRIAAAVYAFAHQPKHPNILQYEISLRYYVTQLQQAGSPYGFHTIGSLMAIHADHYVMVRGFPKRNAAEDFYMINKLAKTGAIWSLTGSPVVLDSRRSDRVPFGTGAAMNRLASQPQQLLYHPAIFQELVIVYRFFTDLWEHCQSSTTNLTSLWNVPFALGDVLLEMGLANVYAQAQRQCGDRPHFLRYLHEWFDGFRTLKAVHALRDRTYPSLPIVAVQQWESHGVIAPIDRPLTLDELNAYNQKLNQRELNQRERAIALTP
jgi:hypothetical protein